MSKVKEEFEYPTKPRPALRNMPKTLLVMAWPKVGKSSIASKFTTDFLPGKSCVVTLGDEGSYDNLAVNEINIPSASKFEERLNDMIEKQPYDVVFFDHLSTFDKWADVLGTLVYMNSTQGRKFNIKDENGPTPGFKNNPKLYFKPGEEGFESVQTLPNGYGYRWTTEEGIRLFEKMKKVAKHVIFIGHLKLDRYTKNETGAVTNSTFLDVTGNLGKYICKNVDGLCTLTRKKDEGFLVFKTATSDLDAGTRYAYLSNQTFKISEKLEDGAIKTYWELIYPNIKK
jgi:hypothetical protein